MQEPLSVADQQEAYTSVPIDDRDVVRPRQKVSEKHGGRGRANQKRTAAEWTPWKDRIRGHKDSILFIATCLMPNNQGGGADSTARSLISASADGTVRVF